MKPQKFKPLQTKRLTLKPLQPSFELAQHIYSVIDRNRDYFRYIAPMAMAKSALAEYDWLKSSQDDWQQGKLANYGIYLRGTRKFIGACGTVDLSWSNGHAELGYWLDSDYAGNGYMAEATRAIEDALFKMGFNRVQIRVNPDNKASCAIPRRLGYVKEGTARQINWNPYMNLYEDIVSYSKLRSEWAAGQKKAHKK